MLTFKKWVEIREAIKATIYTQSDSKGASIDNSDTGGFMDFLLGRDLPTMLNIDDVVNYEPRSKMQQSNKMQRILTAIKNKQSLPPILVRKVDNLRGVSNPRWNGRAMVSTGGTPNSRYKYQVVDGHHRYWAYKEAGVKRIPAIILLPKNIRRQRYWVPGEG